MQPFGFMRGTFVLLLLVCGCGRLGYEAHAPHDDAGADMLVADLGMDEGIDMPSLDLGVDEGMDMPFSDAGADMPDFGEDVDTGPPIEPAIVVTPTSGLVTTEMGGTASFTLVLSTMPTSPVLVLVSSSDTSEGTVSVASVTFTSSNWNAPQSVTVTGVDDIASDGMQAYTVITDSAVSVDPAYAAMAVDDVDVTNLDDDTPGVYVIPTSGLVTTELGASDSFQVRLLAQPSANVTIPLASGDATEVSVSPLTLTFTTANWASLQTVTVTGVDDVEEDGDVSFTVDVGAATSLDTTYDAIDSDDVTGTNRDDELAAINIFPAAGIVTSEAGGTATFNVVLQAAPTADVMVAIDSSDATEGTVSASSVVFSSSNWNVPQVVTVTGMDDFVADGNQPFEIVVGSGVSADPFYSGKPGGVVLATNVDDDTARVIIGEPSAYTTTEVGSTQTVSIVLGSQPTASVTFTISSSDITEGTVTPTLRTFTTANWNIPQNITVTGVNDAFADGDQTYSVTIHVAISGDSNYATLPDSTLAFINIDDESAGVLVTPQSGLTTTESGGTATFTIVLTSQPTASVSTNISSDLLTEGTVSPASVTFTTGNWNTPRTITVTGVNDLVADGDRLYHVVNSAATSTDAMYNGLDVADVTVVNADNDTPGISVSPTAINAPEGASAHFTVVLGTMPTASVTIPLSLMNVAQNSLSAMSVTFTTGNWSTPQTVTVFGTDDGTMDGTFVNTVITAMPTTADLVYAAFNPADVTVTTADRATVTVTPTSGLVTSETGSYANFTVVLDSMPTSNVIIPITTNDASEGMPLQSSLTFTPANWSTPQQVDVYGVNDGTQDGNQPYTILTGSPSSSDLRFAGISVSDVSCTNIDDDMATVVLTPLIAQTSENRTTVPVTVTLGAGPTGSTTLTYSSSDTTEGTVSPTALTMSSGFPTGTTFIINVTGVDDLIDDGDVPYNVRVTVTSADPSYNHYTVPVATLVNLDNEAGTVFVSPSSQLVVSEGGATATTSIRLEHAPTADVTFTLTSDDVGEATVSPTSLTFTTANWSAPRTVTLTGVADGMLDGDQTLLIRTSTITSTDVGYSGTKPPDLSVTNLDLESGRIISATPAYGVTYGQLPTYAGFAVSTDHRFALYASHAQNNIVGDTNLKGDMFLRDRTLGITERISVATDGSQANNYSYEGSMTPDAHYVVFSSIASNLVPGDTNNSHDCFVRDRMAGTTTRVSVATGGAELNGACSSPSISADGRYVAFSDTATNAVAGDTNSTTDVFVHDRMTGTTSRVSLSNAGTQVPVYCGSSVISGDGRFVAFITFASLDPADTNGYIDVYLRDTVLNTTTWVSQRAAPATIGYASVTGPQVSFDGRYVSFWSDANNLVVGDTNATDDVFVRDMLLNTTTRVSVSNGGLQSNGRSGMGSMSADGRRFAFASFASNLAAGDTNGVLDVFVRDLNTSNTYLISRAYTGAPQNNCFDSPGYIQAISPDGTFVVFNTTATDIVPEVFDVDGSYSLFGVDVP